MKRNKKAPDASRTEGSQFFHFKLLIFEVQPVLEHGCL